MDTMNRQQLSQLRGQAAQLIRKYRIPLLVFLLGVALVLIPSRTKKEEPQQTSAEAAETDFNLSATQKQLETLLSAIDGAGRVRLMLTLSSGERIVYQTDSRTVTTSGSTTQETQTVFRQPGGAEKEPAVQSVVYPQYQGALVICDGAERAVLLLVCAGVYLNWSKTQKTAAQDLTETLSAEQVMGEDTLVVADGELLPQEAVAASTNETQAADYFAQVRLSRQESRDSAVELLEETIAYDEGTEIGEAACQTLNNIVGTALSEAQIESLVIAKGYDDCVTYINDGVVCVAVSAPAEGLSDADAALISDIVTSQTDYMLSQVRIIEVKP